MQRPGDYPPMYTFFVYPETRPEISNAIGYHIFNFNKFEKHKILKWERVEAIACNGKLITFVPWR